MLYLAVPDKRYTFDADRPVTPTEHLLRDHREGPRSRAAAHYEEWARLVDKVDEPEAHATALLDPGYSIHYHVWTQPEMLELLRVAADELELDFDVELMLKNRHEVVFVLRKRLTSGEGSRHGRRRLRRREPVASRWRTATPTGSSSRSTTSSGAGRS